MHTNAGAFAHAESQTRGHTHSHRNVRAHAGLAAPAPATQEGETAAMAQGHAAHGAPEAAPAGGLSPDRGTRWQGMCFEVSFTGSCSGAEEAEG